MSAGSEPIAAKMLGAKKSRQVDIATHRHVEKASA
jgi:hypothetical protein